MSATTRTNFVVIAMLLGMFMASLDNTIVSASINKVIADLNGFDSMSWVFTGYMLATTSTMLIFGKLSDLFGRKRFYLIGIFLFLLGSALCGIADSMNQLIVFRIVQGVGSGALMPISFAILFTIFDNPKTAAKMTGIFGAVFGLSSVLGPQLGTWISEHLSWRWCFYINVPLGILSFIILLLSLQETKSDEKPIIDAWGTLLLIMSTTSILLGFEWGGKDYAWDSPQILSLLIGGGIIAGLFTWVEMKAKEPILPIRIFKNRMVSGTSLIVFCQGALMFSVITYLPIYAIGVLGFKNANTVLTPMMLSVMVGATLGGLLITKFTFRTFYWVVTLCCMIGSNLLVHLNGKETKGYMITLMIFLGAGAIGPLMSVAQNAVASNISKEMMGIGNSVVAFWRNIGGIFGASITATVVNNHLKSNLQQALSSSHLPAAQIQAIAKPEALLHVQGDIPPQLLSLLQRALGESIRDGFYFALAMSVLAFVISQLVGNSRFRAKSETKNEA